MNKVFIWRQNLPRETVISRCLVGQCRSFPPTAGFSALEMLFHPEITLSTMAHHYPQLLGHFKDDPSLRERVEIEGTGLVDWGGWK